MIWIIVFSPVAILLFFTLILERKGKKNINMNHNHQHITDEGNAIREGALHQAKNNNNNNLGI
ncbi:hypothetical protein QUF84_09920 [Fictibacillus enclensis]|uniref:hypothetical protein n=1 Tax=Fictibacillus enclensis TaxID=1017270 RepID=UPI0024C0C941|nr:hypothetical protein [Fictibacillus enclensis]MDM5337532.1 hypothetical protein [Fictibacillus enclensis]WHY73906.1 hypothetical protein QNH15_08400 [Fictibacillus enclensis]